MTAPGIRPASAVSMREDRRRPTRLTVIGDRFLLPGLFDAPLRRAIGERLEVSFAELGWPDEETVPGDPASGITEYSGRQESVIAAAADADALVVHMAPVSGDVIDALPRLRFIAVCRGGPVNVDIEAALGRGIRVVKTPGRNANAVAEFTIGAIIASTRRMVSALTRVRTGEWPRGFYRYEDARPELSETTVGLIGYANIGRRVARLLEPFGCTIVFCDPFQSPNEYERRRDIEKVELPELLRRSDIVSLHARLTPETAGLIDDATIALMKPGVHIINTARGELMDEAALHRALKEGRVGGAVIDTFDPEPPDPDNPLLSLPEVIATPHIAGASRTSAHWVAEMVAREVRLWLDGFPPANAC